jgi:DEAD/DEAH box helicase domain-containing protein
LIIGFNIRRFDFAVLQPYLFLSTATLPVLDLLEEIERVRGHRVSLQSLAQGSLEIAKSGQGLDAVSLFKQGKMDSLIQYCLDDVRITKGIYEYGREHGRVYFISNRDWKRYEIPIQWSTVCAAKHEEFPTSLF